MIAVYPGTFDPPTNGHFDIIERSAILFKKVIVAIATNVSKQPIFTNDERVTMLQEGVKKIANVEVVQFKGLAVDYAKQVRANIILRGVRSVGDYEYELQMANANRSISGETIETFLMLPSVNHSFISSRLVREAASLGGDVSRFVPEHVLIAMQKKFGLLP